LTKLKCLSCGNVFNKKALITKGFVGASGAGLGFGVIFPIWPFVLRIYGTCPNCKQKSWMRVLKPWSRN